MRCIKSAVGKEKVDIIFTFSFFNTRSHGHLTTLMGSRFRTDKKKYFFRKGIINFQNSAPQDVAMVMVLVDLTRGLEKFMKDRLVSGH